MKIVKDVQKYMKTNKDEILQRNVNDMLAIIFLLENEMEPVNVDETLKVSERILKSIMMNLLESELTYDYLEFCNSYCELVFNINQNTVKFPNVNLFCRFISKNVELIEWSKKSIGILKLGSIKLKEYAHFNPPSYTISQNLLKEMLEE